MLYSFFVATTEGFSSQIISADFIGLKLVNYGNYAMPNRTALNAFQLYSGMLTGQS